MKVRFTIPVFDSASCTTLDGSMDLPEEKVILYAGKNVDHLVGEDDKARSFLNALKGLEPKENEGPTKAELLEEAKAKGIKGAAQMNKDALIEALKGLEPKE
jgi:hypothetical protein